MANEIFISYRRADEPKARLLYNLLKERGVEAWYDAKIEAGEDWRTTTANALNDAPIFVLLMSRLASESGDIAKELAAATHKRKLVVPVRLDDMQLEGMFLYELASRNWIDAYHNTEQKLADLADKLAALVKAGMSPEAAAALEVSAAEIAATKGEAGKKGGKRDAYAAASGEKRKAGSVAILSAAAVALVAAAGGGVWFFTKSQNPAPTAQADTPAAVASMAAIAPAPGAVGASPASASAEPAAAKPGLAASLTELAATAKAQGRKDVDVAALTDAGARLGALDPKVLSGNTLPADVNDVALAAARGHIAAIAADPVVVSMKSDVRAVIAEQKASGAKLDPVLSGAITDADAALAAIKAAADAAGGTDGAAAVLAAASAQKSFDTLAERQPATSNAFLMSKRASYTANSAAARAAAAKIAQVFGGVKKPGVFASKDNKEAYKYLVATDTWSRARMAEVDANAAAIATADRKTLAKHAALAATARTELETALGHVREQATKLGG